MSDLLRLDKILSLAGITRTAARKIIAAGRVTVGDTVQRDPGFKTRIPDVRVDGELPGAETEIHLMLNKPAGVITATEDKKLPTVVDLLPEKYQNRKIGPIGRLDRDVTGLVILTTDGEMAHRLISPRHKAEKRYRAICEGSLTQADADAFAAGIELSDFTALPAKLEILSSGESESTADVILTEGKFHQVKRMFIAIGHPLKSLSRLQIGGVTLDPALKEGEFRPLTESEIQNLRSN